MLVLVNWIYQTDWSPGSYIVKYHQRKATCLHFFSGHIAISKKKKVSKHKARIYKAKDIFQSYKLWSDYDKAIKHKKL